MGWRAVAPSSGWRPPGWRRTKRTRGRRLAARGRQLVEAVLLVGTTLLATGCATGTAIPGQSPSVTISRLEDEPIGFAMAPEVELLAAYELSARDPRFGGFSAIETDGVALWLLGDRAMLWQADMALDAATGDLVLEAWHVGALLTDGTDRRPLDSEGLALGPDGTLFAAFEHDDSLRRLVRAPSGDWSSERLHEGRLIEGAPQNQGLEALARLADGSLVAVSEGARRAPGVASAARLAGDHVIPFGYSVEAGFRPVGAAVLGDHLYVLERRVGVLAGWQTRLTRSPLPTTLPHATGDQATLEGETLIRIGAGPLAENHEGVAILTDSQGAASIFLIADDNQSALQRTLLLVFSYAG